jgi:hypothetical protein
MDITDNAAKILPILDKHIEKFTSTEADAKASDTKEEEAGDSESKAADEVKGEEAKSAEESKEAEAEGKGDDTEQ